MADTDLDICSRVLVALGDKPITSFAGKATANVLARTHYEKVLRQLLGEYRWNFARKTLQLSRNVAAPARSKWSASYALPPDWLLTHVVEVGEWPIEWDAGPGAILCDATVDQAVLLTYSRRVPTDELPEFFIAYLEAALAAKWAFPLTAQESLTAAALKQATMQKVLARSADAQSSTAKRMPISRMMAARRGARR